MENFNGKKYSITLPADLLFSSSVRRVSDEIFKHLGFTDPDLFRLVLVIDELFMNSIQHGSKDDNSSVHVTYEYEKEKKVIVTIDDEGTGNAKSCPDILQKKMSREFQCDNLEKISGRGLAQIALNLADNLEFKQNSYGGMRVIFEKLLPKK